MLKGIGVNSGDILEFFLRVTQSSPPTPTPNFCVVAEMDIIHMIIHLIFFLKTEHESENILQKFSKRNFFQKLEKYKTINTSF